MVVVECLRDGVDVICCDVMICNEMYNSFKDTALGSFGIGFFSLYCDFFFQKGFSFGGGAGSGSLTSGALYIFTGCAIVLKSKGVWFGV